MVAEELTPIQQALRLLGLKQTDTNVDQLHVMVEALAIFQEHTDRLGELWREVEPEDTAHHIRHKAQRVFHAEVNGAERDRESLEDFGRDSALDLINYAAFYVRQKDGDA